LLLFLNTENRRIEQEVTQSEKKEEKAELSTGNSKVPQPKTKPISDAKSRVTKKPFGIYITPQSSPVKPEKFTGYHTGTDFETTSKEKNHAVPVYALCTGKIRVKQIVSGYGGVIVQDCSLDGQSVTVLYGHIDIRRSNVQINQEVKGGKILSILAQAYSQYSGGERKHLHLGIYKGNDIDYRGYVRGKNELSGWIDMYSGLD
jgi:hypothetical protein